MFLRPEIVALLLPALVSTLVAMLLARPVIGWIRKLRWVDAPSRRKVHDGLVPLAGGAIVLAATLLVVVAFGLWDAPAWQFWIGASMIFLVSFFDDRFPIRARYRFFTQLSAAAIVCSGGLVLTTLGHPLGFSAGLGLAAVPFTVVGIAALTNAINMMDGLDGLAGGVVAIALAWLACVMMLIGFDAEPAGVAAATFQGAHVAGVIVGALLVFLAYNLRTPWRKRAAIFMGDGGSMTLGFAVASLAVYACTVRGPQGVPPVVVMWIVGLPVIDMFACIVRRVAIERETPMSPDRKHLHHLLQAIGLPVGLVVPLLHLIAIAMGAVGVVGWRTGVPEYVLGWSFIGLFAAYLMFSLGYWVQHDVRMASPRQAPRTAARRTVAAGRAGEPVVALSQTVREGRE